MVETFGCFRTSKSICRANPLCVGADRTIASPDQAPHVLPIEGEGKLRQRLPGPNRECRNCRSSHRRKHADASQAIGLVSRSRAELEEGLMTGHVRRRGERSWELKFDAGTRCRHRQAQDAIRQLQRDEAAGAVQAGRADRRRSARAPTSSRSNSRSANSRGRASTNGKPPATSRPARRSAINQLVENQIVPHLGAKPLQKLSRLDIEGWHTALQSDGTGGPHHRPCAPRPVQGPERRRK